MTDQPTDGVAARAWEADWCTCGFGGGDWTERYATEAELRAAIAEREEALTDATLREVRSPDGQPWGTRRLGGWKIPPEEDSDGA